MTFNSELVKQIKLSISVFLVSIIYWSNFLMFEFLQHVNLIKMPELKESLMCIRKKNKVSWQKIFP
jgi:hypothetical protein